jgi:dTDP-glucose pyrophosphorylase
MIDSWHTTCVPLHMTIEAAIVSLNQNAFQILLVCEEGFLLKGTLTDGDIRRALIEHKPMDTPIQQVMNTNPIVSQKGDDLTHIRKLMDLHSVNQIPSVEKGIVVDLHTYKTVTKPPKHDIPVLLMAGGFGKRLRPLTNNCPKPLLKVGDKAILETIIENFQAAGFSRFYITTHYLDSMIKNHFGDGHNFGVQIEYIHEDRPLGTAGALGHLPPSENDRPVMMMNGDILTNVQFNQLINFHENQCSSATICVRQQEYQIPYGVVEGEQGQISFIREKPVIRHFINAGIYVINPDLRDLVKPGVTLDMPNLINRGAREHFSISMYPLHEYWLDIGQIPDYNKAQKDFVEGLSA